MKFCMQGTNVILANTTTNNVLQGQRYERAPANCYGALFVTGSNLGLTCELNCGGVSVTPPTGVNAQNRYPVVPDDSLVDGWSVGNGKLIQVTVVNTTGGNLNVFWRVELLVARGR
jgi:hypothetical protein